MKTIPTLLILLCFSFVSLAQVGIGTSSPNTSSVLDIASSDKGVLIPRMTTVQRDAIAGAANGLMIYNTDTDEIQFNSNNPTTPIWEALSPVAVSTAIIGDSMKYSNTDITTDLNTATTINTPLFGTSNWNDNPALYVVSGNQVTITQAGRYEVIVNTSLINTGGGERTSPEMRLALDGTGVGAFGNTGYMRSLSGHDESSMHIREIIEVGANQVLTISIVRAAQVAQVNLRSAGTSNIYIEKIL